jgi:Mrp family chromosome partitioning ATPase
LGVLTALLLGFLRGGFGGPRPLEEATGLPVLEMVPELDRRQLAELFGPATTGAASPIRGLAFALQARLPPGRGRALLLTSSLPGEGKSLLALGLGRAAALSGRRVIVVELDFWRPSLTQLASSLPLEPCGRSLAGSPIRIDRTSGLAIACTDLPLLEAERSMAVRELLTALDPLREAYDLILLDGPPSSPYRTCCPPPPRPTAPCSWSASKAPTATRSRPAWNAWPAPVPASSAPCFPA